MDPQNNSLPTASMPLPPKPKSQKFILIGIIVLLLLAGSAASIFILNSSKKAEVENSKITIEPSAIPTSDPSIVDEWKTYKNTNSTSVINTSATLTAIPQPTLTKEEVLKNAILAALKAKYKNDGSTLKITVSKIKGNYAQGGVNDEGGGGIWSAAKVSGTWILVWDGNGIILCSNLASFPDYPVNMIPECFDDKTQELIKR